MYFARNGVIGRPLCRPRLAHAHDSLTPRSGFVQPAFRAFMTHEFRSESVENGTRLGVPPLLRFVLRWKCLVGNIFHLDRLQPGFSLGLQLDREGSDLIF